MAISFSFYGFIDENTTYSLHNYQMIHNMYELLIAIFWNRYRTNTLKFVRRVLHVSVYNCRKSNRNTNWPFVKRATDRSVYIIFVACILIMPSECDKTTNMIRQTKLTKR